MDDYRVQEYVHDNGCFHKKCIYAISRTWYHNANNDSLCRRLVILPPDDPYGERLPITVRSWDRMTALVQKAEAEEHRLEVAREGRS